MVGEAREVIGYPRLYVSIALQTFCTMALSERYEVLARTAQRIALPGRPVS